jgi:hypothetical protein
MHKKYLISMTSLLVGLGFSDAAVAADGRVLTDAAWREDIETVVTSIREIHPRPFRSIDQSTFDDASRKLFDRLPEMSDKEIVVRLAALVALVDDGHTRLSIPREHPEVGLEFGHTATAEPEHSALRFKQLPLAFEQFEDGVYVVAANSGYARLIGHRVAEIDGTPIAEAMEAVRAITFAENSQLDALMGADRLSLPEALLALGVTHSVEAVVLALVDENNVVSKEAIKPLQTEALDWTATFAGEPTPLRLRRPEEKFWSEYIKDGHFVYMQMDEIADGDIPLAEFVVNTLGEAERKSAKLVIDVRNNFGGSGGLNKTLVTSIIRSDFLNRYDRTFVLIGRRTFSAAQMLVNELEQYTRVTFIGEPTGSRPDHFGDPRKLRLKHSGLTLRVSRLHWSSYTAFDERESTNPDFVAKWTSKDFFAGNDPALNLALSLNSVSLKALLRGALEQRDMEQVARYTLESKLSADSYRDDFSTVLLELGDEFESTDQIETADLAYQVGRYFYPDHEGLKSALESLASRGN